MAILLGEKAVGGFGSMICTSHQALILGGFWVQLESSAETLLYVGVVLQVTEAVFPE